LTAWKRQRPPPNHPHRRKKSHRLQESPATTRSAPVKRSTESQETTASQWMNSVSTTTLTQNNPFTPARDSWLHRRALSERSLFPERQDARCDLTLHVFRSLLEAFCFWIASMANSEADTGRLNGIPAFYGVTSNGVLHITLPCGPSTFTCQSPMS
jgi:hypothetical protein